MIKGLQVSDASKALRKIQTGVFKTSIPTSQNFSLDSFATDLAFCFKLDFRILTLTAGLRLHDLVKPIGIKLGMRNFI